MRLLYLVKKLWAWCLPRRKVKIIEGDTPPEKLHRKHLTLAREDGEDWAVAFQCPCGCGRRIELMLIEEAKPNWALSISKGNIPTLSPSVWLKTGCKSHFWLRNGKIDWC